MNSEILKEATKDEHREAEKSLFMKMLIKGEYTEEQWNNYLTNLYFLYNIVESRIDLPKFLVRSNLIFDDIGGKYGKVVPSTIEYVKHVSNLDLTQTYAHLYVRWLGDLFGGTFISKNCKYSCSYLKYDKPEIALTKIRWFVNPFQADIVGEAKVAFNYAKRLMDELL
jgi:hypothetical protein